MMNALLRKLPSQICFMDHEPKSFTKLCMLTALANTPLIVFLIHFLTGLNHGVPFESAARVVGFMNKELVIDGKGSVVRL